MSGTVYCYDTEFLEDGTTIELISIGIVCEDGREYYAVASDVDWSRVMAHDWLVRNVVPSLPLRNRAGLDKYLAHPQHMHPKPSMELVELDTTSVAVKPKWVIANEVREFLVRGLRPADARHPEPFYFEGDRPELWADYAAYDHVALAQLWGPMINLPEGIPMWTHDIEQAIEDVPGFKKPAQESGQHNALQDARHDMRVLTALREAGLTRA